MLYFLSDNKPIRLLYQVVLCALVGVSSAGPALAEEVVPPAVESPNPAMVSNAPQGMDEIPLAQCLPQQRAIQAINQRPLAIRWLFLPYRGQLEVKHRHCLKQQSLLEQAQLQALPGPAAASVMPRKPAKVAQPARSSSKASWFKWPMWPRPHAQP